jgi:hypothetical protein
MEVQAEGRELVLTRLRAAQHRSLGVASVHHASAFNNDVLDCILLFSVSSRRQYQMATRFSLQGLQ